MNTILPLQSPILFCGYPLCLKSCILVFDSAICSPLCHSGGGRSPAETTDAVKRFWIPASAGMTVVVNFKSVLMNSCLGFLYDHVLFYRHL